MPVVVVATITPKPEHRDEVRAALQDAVAQVHDEDGCELYALHADEDKFVMIERWTSPEALKTHGAASPGLQQLNQALEGKLEGPLDVWRLQPVPAGDDRKGRL